MKYPDCPLICINVMNINIFKWIEAHKVLFLGFGVFAVLGFAAHFANPSYAEQRVFKQNQNQLELLSNEIKKNYPVSYSQIAVSDLIQKQAIPFEMLVSSSSEIRTMWGTRIFIEPVFNPRYEKAFAIKYEEIPNYVCEGIANHLPMSVSDFKINNKSVIFQGKVDYVYAAQICRKNDKNVLDFVYR